MKTSMQGNFTPIRQLLFALGSAGFNLLERLVVLYVPFFFLPPAEYGVPNLVPEKTSLGVITVLGLALVVGRIFDGLADPIIAGLSDNNRSPLGRRKVFLLMSALPLAAFGALIFFPPWGTGVSLLNGVWLAVLLCCFYIAYTGYVNPYLALISDLGETEDLRLKLSTKIALFGLAATLLVTAGFPELLTYLTNAGTGLRDAFQSTVLVFAAVAAVLLYAASLAFRELPRAAAPDRQSNAQPAGTWAALRETFAHKTFRTFVLGEMLVQFAVNISTMALLYYVVVLFQKPKSYMSVVAAAMGVVAVISFPLVNAAARRYGKRKVLIAGVYVLMLCGGGLFLLSFNLTGGLEVLGLLVLAMCGFPLAALAILINPTIAEMARDHASETGQSREAMFFAARAIPVKLVIALAGATFSWLLSAFGKDIQNPLGVQLSLLVIAIAAAGGLFFLLKLPREETKGQTPRLTRPVSTKL